MTRRRSPNRSWLVGSVCLLGLLGLGCEEEPEVAPSYPFTFTAHADGQPLEGVQVMVEGVALPGTTNTEGVMRHALTGPEGAPIRINAQCPEGHRSPADPETRTLRHVVGLDPASQDRGIQVTFECPPEHRDVVVIVRTNDQPNLPILVDGRETTRTDASGTAHIHMRVQPNHSFQVQIATASNTQLRPVDPTHPFTVADEDSVFQWDREFEIEAPPRPRRRRRRPAAAAPIRLPIRIGGR
ncbi:MAG: hypothetical protein AB8I08_26465 [Sandaracinaceae bacterium]